MTQSAQDSLKLSALVRHGARTDPKVKLACFRLWVENGRSYRRSSELSGIPEPTLRNWGVTEDWEQRRRDQAHAFLPGVTTESAIGLKLAAHNAIIRLQQIAFDAAEYATEPRLREVQALLGIVDRAGFSPIGARNPVEIATTQPRKRTNFASLSPDELLARERDIDGS
jgi:hypothetical protein